MSFVLHTAAWMFLLFWLGHGLFRFVELVFGGQPSDRKPVFYVWMLCCVGNGIWTVVSHWR